MLQHSGTCSPDRQRSRRLYQTDFLPEDAVIDIHDLEDGAGTWKRARIAWVRHKTLISHRKLGRLLENFDAARPPDDRPRAMGRPVGRRHTIEALSSETESLDMFSRTEPPSRVGVDRPAIPRPTPPCAVHAPACGVHQAAVLVVEAVAAVHGDAVVPHDQIALAPGMRPGEFRLGDVAPQLVEQRFPSSIGRPTT